jgi:hypothetical protein
MMFSLTSNKMVSRIADPRHDSSSLLVGIHIRDLDTDRKDLLHHRHKSRCGKSFHNVISYLVRNTPPREGTRDVEKFTYLTYIRTYIRTYVSDFDFTYIPATPRDC